MKTIVHLSDLHFGRTDPDLLGPLAEQVRAARPDLVVVSGDLTQRARDHEFRAARAFLDGLPGPHLAVPGNHDVPLYNPVARLLFGLHGYQRYIARDITPFYCDDECAVLGVNTARSLAVSGGRISRGQLRAIGRRLREVPAGLVKVLVTHHPFDLPPRSHHENVVGGARRAIEELAELGVDIVLSGHVHQAHSGHSATRFRSEHRALLFVQAGTATSTRVRDEPNSWNVVRLDAGAVQVERKAWSDPRSNFVTVDHQVFRRAPSGWLSEALALPALA
ncbi:MAG TPA: metallophosphoesterase [Polyangiaceae bacterium]|nr:metallophosphoesterase [Polyangiaceae bacterium]